MGEEGVQVVPDGTLPLPSVLKLEPHDRVYELPPPDAVMMIGSLAGKPLPLTLNVSDVADPVQEVEEPSIHIVRLAPDDTVSVACASCESANALIVWEPELV
jgi:hypothetical protein